MRSSSLTLLALISCSAILLVSVECQNLRSQSAIEFTVDVQTTKAKSSKFWPQKISKRENLSEIFAHLPDGQNRLLIFSLDNESYIMLWEQEGVSAEEKEAYAYRFKRNQEKNTTIKYAVRVNNRNDLSAEYILNNDHRIKITRSN